MRKKIGFIIKVNLIAAKSWTSSKTWSFKIEMSWRACRKSLKRANKMMWCLTNILLASKNLSNNLYAVAYVIMF